MYTRCPTCRTLFRIQAQQLKSARGKVRCGECQTTFDALAYLVNFDELSESEQKTISAAVEKSGQWQLPFDAPAAASGENEPANQQDKEPTAGTTPEAPSAPPEAPAATPPGEAKSKPIDEHPPSAAPTPASKTVESTASESIPAEPEQQAPESIAEEVEPSAVEPIVAEAQPTVAEPITEDAEPNADEPRRYILREEEVVQRSLASRIGWGFATLLMTTVLAGQLVFANKDELAREPRWRPWLEQACQVAGCTLPVQRDLADIEMIERTVISHPKYQHALLITATLLNKAKFAQPYPQVELTMTDLDQKVVASRRFMPREYLKDSDPTKLFAAGGAVQLQLEITDPGEKAVGFEFNFY